MLILAFMFLPIPMFKISFSLYRSSSSSSIFSSSGNSRHDDKSLNDETAAATSIQARSRSSNIDKGENHS